ncbi:MAG TPA: isoprenylcysteine carboxylmethyltransferase family protein [Aestuariivirga sp.]|nr:isoprenylcysteine carboxylmethyltransferase family protein [Aestuariivirga sp.]
MGATGEVIRMKLPQWTWVSDLLGRIGIVVFFAQGAAAKSQAIYQSLVAWWAASPAFEPLHLLSEMACLAFLLLVVATTIVRLKPLRSAEGLEPRLTALAGTFAMVFLVLLPPTITLPSEIKVLALCLTLTGFSLSAYVLYWLGRSFSIMAEARRLVTGGPYALVRHPLYVVEEIAVIGVLLLNLSLPAILLIGFQWMMQLRRMRHEERVLAQAFPEYEAYAAVTPRILPRLFARPVRKLA